MRRIHQRLGQVLAAGAAGLILLSGLPGRDARAEDVEIYQGAPPAAEALAEMLYPEAAPGRTRSIVLGKSGPAAAPKAFGFLIHFAFDSAEVLPESMPYLDEVARMMKLEQMEGKRIRVEGHTDATGPDAYNQDLSVRRARAVSRYLAEHGVAADRVTTGGKGESEPLADRDPVDPLNRRVQFHRAD
jgi:outer membrane protein OmpA-like peptidoglycan-associated protein